MGNILTNTEILQLKKALKKKIHEPSLQISFLFIELPMIGGFANQINGNTSESRIKHFYNETKKILTERIVEFVDVYKSHKGDFVAEEGDWDTYLENISFYEKSIKDAVTRNSGAVVILNLWNSLFPIINGFVKVFSNK